MNLSPAHKQGSDRHTLVSMLTVIKTLFIVSVISVLVFSAESSWANTPHKIQSIIQTANRLLGTPYRSGGKSPDQGFDCSGFVSFVLKQHGMDLGASSPELVKKGRKITRHELRAGDLVFFTSKRKSKRVAHVGIYLGNGEFIHAASRNHRIQVNELAENYWARHYYGARRI